MCLEKECCFFFDSVGDLSASASSDNLSASLIGISKKELIMMPPEEKLAMVDRRAQDHEDKQEVTATLFSHDFWPDSCKLHKLRGTITRSLHLKKCQITVSLSFSF